MNNVIITGDIHGNFEYLNKLINKFKYKLDLIICCGDFGYWPSSSTPLNIESQGVTILWCDGNHEDHWAIHKLSDNEITKNVFYMPRGSTYKLRDGRTILFMGGAASIDKQYRTLGIDWFPEETISQKDMMDLPNIKIDIFITHTCPKELHSLMLDEEPNYINDPSIYALSTLWQIYKPPLWFFGHWHQYNEGDLENTKWYSLSCVDSNSKWWMWLPTINGNLK